MSAPSFPRFAVLAVLLLLMAATRFTHAGSANALPDATWAVFFVGGFYLSRDWRWVLPVFFFVVVGADVLAISHYGINNYCATAAYGFIVPAYAVLWLGGAWLRRHEQRAATDLARLLVSFAVSVTLCFAITHSAFYWLGSRLPRPTLAEWGSVFVQWYPLFLSVTGIYVAVAALLHIALAHLWRSGILPSQPDARV